MNRALSLPLRVGIPLALAISAGIVLVVSAVQARILGRGLELAIDPISLVALSIPFLLLAVGGVRDWMAWTIAFALSGALWAWLLHELTLSEGVNFALPLILWIAAPLLISAAALVAAGLRGRIAWAQD